MSAAERLIRALYSLTDGQPGQWRMITSLGRVGTAGAIDTAMRAGWIDIEGGHSVRLTDAGRRQVKGRSAPAGPPDWPWRALFVGAPQP